ncbi:MAG: carbon starvation protein A [Planctomycetota bacterium]|nr:MAG: carbon starvation protein A [Planctomycetota bacterium]
MSLLAILLPTAVVLLVAYRLYGGLLARLFRLDASAITPAVALRDDIDYEPIPSSLLLGQHFSAIAAAGPIVGPILAGVAFGWAPALAWILLGSIFIGGVHDFAALVASVRHKARSIAEVVRDHMSRRSYILFLSFVWIALVYIIVAFTDITASSFVGKQVLENGEGVSGGGIASSSLLYLVLPLVMGVCIRYLKMPIWLATVIFVPLVGLAIWVGQQIPFDLAATLGTTDANAQKIWGVLLLAYCLVAAMAPMWLLLQPRGHLGGCFLYVALFGAVVGLVFSDRLLGGDSQIRYPAFTTWTAKSGPLIPMLFITIACGACSGFHSLIASGTTSKQLKNELDARPIGYGTMLLEALVATVSLCCVMVLPEGDPHTAQPPNFIYALGMGRFLEILGVPTALGVSFALMAFTTFVYDTLDVCTRLGRYIIQELTGLSGKAGAWLGTALTAGAPLFFLLRPHLDAAGNPVPAWKTFWSLFGASNQLLAALTLLGITVWLWRTRREVWVWYVTGLPTLFMYVMSTWALASMTLPKFQSETGWVFPADPVPWAGVVLLVLAGVMLVEAIRAIAGTGGPPSSVATVSLPVAGAAAR